MASFAWPSVMVLKGSRLLIARSRVWDEPRKEVSHPNNNFSQFNDIKATQTKFIISHAFQLEKGMRSAHFNFILKALPTNLKRGLDQVWTEFTWGAGRTALSCQCQS